MISTLHYDAKDKEDKAQRAHKRTKEQFRHRTIGQQIYEAIIRPNQLQSPSKYTKARQLKDVLLVHDTPYKRPS